MAFGTGLLDDPLDYIGDGAVAAGINQVGPELFFGLVRYQRHDLNQSITNSCVWMYLKQALWTLTGVYDLPRISLSELAGYYSTRKRQANGGDILDLGCSPSVASEVVQQQGFCLESDWEFKVSRVDKEPPFHAFISMSKHKWFYDRRVLSVDEELCNSIRVIGASYIPLGIGLTVDDTLVHWNRSWGPWRRTEPAKGRHMVTYHAHEKAGLWVIGSYGSNHGENNTVLVSWDTIRSRETYPVMAPAINRELVARMMKGK